MQRINEIVSRIQTIQAQVERPPVSGAFQSLLDARIADSDHRQQPDDRSTTGHAGGFPPAMLATMTARSSVTLGSMVNGPGSITSINPAGSVAPTGGGYFPTHHVSDGTVMTSEELSEYMTLNRIEARNGRLESHELSAVSGSWHGNGRLLQPAAEAWELMRTAAARDGVDLQAIDTYRTWESQDRAYRAHLAGTKKANVLPPGTSRHGAGLAIDVTNGSIIDRSDREWQWLEANGRSFGWHPISNEAWHWEFRGV